MEKRIKIAIDRYDFNDPRYLALTENELALLDYLFKNGYLHEDTIYTNLEELTFTEF